MRRIMRPLGLALALAGLVGSIIFGDRPVAQASGPGQPTPTPTSSQGAGGGGHEG